MKFVVTCTKSREIEVVVEAESKEDAEDCVEEAMTSGFFDVYDCINYHDELYADEAEDSAVADFCVVNRELQKIDAPDQVELKLEADDET